MTLKCPISQCSMQHKKRSRPLVLAQDYELGHRGCESARHMVLLVDVRLPEARSAVVPGEVVVRLQSDLSCQWRHDLALVWSVARKQCAYELSLCPRRVRWRIYSEESRQTAYLGRTGCRTDSTSSRTACAEWWDPPMNVSPSMSLVRRNFDERCQRRRRCGR